MYATPATGSSQNQNDLEDYLLGKKRVDKILIGTENEKVSSFSLLQLSPVLVFFSDRCRTQELHRRSECEYSA